MCASIHTALGRCGPVPLHTAREPSLPAIQRRFLRLLARLWPILRTWNFAHPTGLTARAEHPPDLLADDHALLVHDEQAVTRA
jgi:hypothetical protein